MEVDKKLKALLISEGYKYICYVEGKGVCALLPFLFTVGLVTGLDEGGDKGRYCYAHKDVAYAILALYQWEMSKDEVEGDPEDAYWIKYKGLGVAEYDNPNIL